MCPELVEKIKGIKVDGQKVDLSDIFDQDTQQIEGDVIVTKNPCSHPGDIRKLVAISKDDERVEKFIHLVNVIVFSSQGVRPE